MHPTNAKDPDTGQGVEVSDPSKGINRMSTLTQPAEIVMKVKDRLATIDAEIARLNDQRALAFIAERDDWTARGYEAHVLQNFAKTRWQEPLARRHLVNIWETIWSYGDGWQHRLTATPIYREDDPIKEWGPYSPPWSNGVKIERGEFVCTLADDLQIVVVKVKNIEPTREQYTRAVARLRSVAAREYMRVSARDRVVTLKSPMNDIVHEGDITSAYLWLHGITEDVRKAVAA